MLSSICNSDKIYQEIEISFYREKNLFPTKKQTGNPELSPFQGNYGTCYLKLSLTELPPADLPIFFF